MGLQDGTHRDCRVEEGRVGEEQSMADTVGILLALADNSHRDTGFLVNKKEEERTGSEKD